MLAYLKAENAYFDAAMTPHRALMDELFEEMKGRIKETTARSRSATAIISIGGAPHAGHAIPDLVPQAFAGGEDEVIFDEPVEAEGKDYFRLGALEVSPTAGSRPWSTTMARNGSLRIREPATGKDLETVTEVGIGRPVWTSDSGGIVFTEVNEIGEAISARFRLGSSAHGRPHALRGERGARVQRRGGQVDRQVADARLDRRQCDQRGAVRVRGRPALPLTLISRRKPNRQYDVDAAHGKLWIVTNDEHVNFRLAEADLAAPG